MTDATRGWRALLVVALFGAIGGGANASLCLSRLPEAVHENPEFGWTIVPAGAIHGALLAIIPVAAVLGAWHLSPIWRSLLALPVGWLAGYLSWIPLAHWAIDEPWGRSLLWPFQDESWLSVAWAPFAYFGGVSIIYFTLLSVLGHRRGWLLQTVYGVSAGVLGSAWFWSEFEPWYFATIHGTIWGLLVGAGVQRASYFTKPKEGDVA